MKNYQWLGLELLTSLVLVTSALHSEDYPYANGQAVFVQSPYTSSLYTNYSYDPRLGKPSRLPPYTTNSAVFIQQPYATAQQTVTSYPASGQFSLPYKESSYASPAAYPATVAPAYPFATVSPFTSSPYVTTTQYPAYTYPYTSTPYSTINYTSTQTYPYTSNRQTVTYPSTVVQQSRNASPSTTYNAYPVTTAVQYPNPVTTTAVPETAVQPPVPPPARPYSYPSVFRD